jgi:periplasmic protein TonB
MTATLQSLRIPLVLPVAAVITVGLFLMMRQLIDIGPVRPVLVEDAPPVEIRFDVEEIEPNHVREPILVEVIAPPQMPVMRTEASRVNAVTSDVGYRLPDISPAVIDMSGNGMINANRPLSPTVRIEPVYPARALERGLEGQCTVVFDITPQGTTANVRPLNCSSSLFESATVNAVSRWRYSPQVTDGQPAMYRGATTQLVYRMEG